MKKLKKAEMVLKGQVPVGHRATGLSGPGHKPSRRGQVQHVHAELEVMSEADENNEWVVKLHYSFQAAHGHTSVSVGLQSFCGRGGARAAAHRTKSSCIWSWTTFLEGT